MHSEEKLFIQKKTLLSYKSTVQIYITNELIYSIEQSYKMLNIIKDLVFNNFNWV